MKQPLGYTLIELMIVISIISALIAFGISSYTKAQLRQVGQLASETIISVFQANQKIANIGNKDCVGKFIGQSITAANSSLTAESICEGNNRGVPVITVISGITFNDSYTIIFQPLSLGIDLGNGVDELLIKYHNKSNLLYQIKLNNSGTMEYQGIQASQ